LVLGAAGAAAAQTPTDTTKKPQMQSYQTPSYQRTIPDSLRSQTKITEDSARVLALSKMPSGTIQALVLERRHGKLTWSFAIHDQAKANNTQVYVDALNGSVTSATQKSAS
jgi:hypothetical protein